MRALFRFPVLVAGMFAAVLPYRYWTRLSARIPMGPAAFLSGIATILAGRLRTLYPLTTQADLEAIRKSVHYDLPAPPVRPE